MDDRKEKTKFWQNWMTIIILLSITIMVIWSNIQGPAIRSEIDENISINNGTYVSESNVRSEIDKNIPIGGGIHSQIGYNKNVQIGSDSNILSENDANILTNKMDNDTFFQNWVTVSFDVINSNLNCISESSYKKDFANIEKCGKFLEENSNISLKSINEYNNISPHIKIISDEYEIALKNYSIAGKKLAVGAKNKNVSQMGDAIVYIQDGNDHIKTINNILYQDSIDSKYKNTTGNNTINTITGNNTSG